MNTFTEYYNKTNMLSEVKLSRVWKHLTDMKTTVGIITAFRGEYDLNENIRRNKELASTLKGMGFGYFFVEGSWIENEGESNEQHVSETSIFVTSTGNPEAMKRKLIELAKKYNQDGFSFKAAGANTYTIIDKNGKTILSFDNVKFNKLASVYTRMRNATGSFVFENTAYTDGGFITRLINKG